MAKRYKCPYCEKRDERKNLITHIDKRHQEMLPEGYNGARVMYDLINHTDGHGTCRVCKNPTQWNPKAQKYDVLCGNPKCKEAMREEYKKNMLRVRGTYNILNDPKQQEKMLANRSISGKYKFRDGGIVVYTGSYEKKFLEFIDNVMEIPSKDIMMPGPTLEYTYKGEKHFYITDCLYIPFNAIIEIKDGGDNPNNKLTPGMIASREKTVQKEKLITDRGEYNYIRLTNNDFTQLIEFFMEIKEKILNEDYSKTVRIHEATKTSVKSLYHVSQTNLDGKTLNPSIPNNYFTKNGFEDNTTSRVCFAPSIDKCLRALSQNCVGMELYVHIPTGKFETLKPNHSEVPDSKVTGEIWITKPVKVKCIGKIKVTGDKGEDGLPFKYGNNTAELYDWNWEWIDKYTTESYDAISEEAILSENMETRLTTNPFKNEMTLYHGTSMKLDIIAPTSYNAGSRISNTRMSSFWSDEYFIAEEFAIFRTVEEMDYFIAFRSDLQGLIVLPSQYDEIVNKLKSKIIYIYEKTLSKEFIGIGHSNYFSEYTIDVPVKPDKVHIETYKQFKNFIKDHLEVFSTDDIEEVKKIINANNLGKGIDGGIMRKILVGNLDDFKRKIKKAKKLRK